MKITLKKIIINNFKGINNLAIDFSEKTTNIMGANHTGKTTVADAILWVLFGKNSRGQTVFGISPKDEHNKTINHLDNEAILTLTADDREITLRKIRKQTWTRPRGADTEKLTGYTTDCFINGNKYSATDYQEEINNICREELFRAITEPTYFPTLNAEQQRALLVKMVGGVSQEEITEHRQEFVDLLKAMDGEDVKSYRERLAYKIKNIKADMEVLPVRITENEAIRQELVNKGANFGAIRKRLDELKTAIAQYDEQLEDKTARESQVYKQRAEQRARINTLRLERQNIEDEIERKNTIAANDHRKKTDQAKAEVDTVQRAIRLNEQDAEDNQRSLQYIERRTEDFRRRWQEVENEQFAWDESEGICPTCGQALPTEDVENRKSAAWENWTKAHMAKQDNLDKEAEEIKQRRDAIEAIIATCRQKRAQLEQELKRTEQILQAALSEPKPTAADYRENQAWQDIDRKIKEAEETLTSAITDSQTTADTNIIRQKRAQLIQERDTLIQDLAREGQIKERETRIQEIEAQMKQLAQQLAQLEEADHNANRYELAAIQKLEEKVNGLFSLIRFNMFEMQLNGKAKPTCELTMHGVPYNDLSNSEKINAGLDCIRAMNLYNNTYAPIIIDNAESCNEVLPTESQQVLLIVSQDSSLTIVND